MGYFGVDNAEFDAYKKSAYTEFDRLQNQIAEFHEKLQANVAELKTQIQQTSPVSEELAREAAAAAERSLQNIKSIENSFGSALNEINDLKAGASSELSEILNFKSQIKTEHTEVSEIAEKAEQLYLALSDKKNFADESADQMSEKIEEFNSYLEQSKSLPDSLESTNGLLAECNKIYDNIQTLLTHTLKRKSEIDEIYKEIFGESISSSEGETQHVPGLKYELNTAYENINKNLINLENSLKRSTAEINEKFQKKLDEQIDEFDILVSSSNDRFKSIDNQLTGLLPGAMAAGLSAAYEEKKADEIKSLASFDTTFRLAILGMLFVSAIPLGIDLYLLIWKSKDLVQILKDTPTLLLAIMPLYFPILWLAYSSNKKSNLSKRLIEEYTHKSVLGKTFSGLSNQIETLQHQGAVKEELRTKLLFNVLQVSAENPGKLITNYSKSDHPLMDALENSAKLADSIGALSKIPGFSALADKLSKKADEMLNENKKRVEDGLEAQKALEEKSEDNADSKSKSGA